MNDFTFSTLLKIFCLSFWICLLPGCQEGPVLEQHPVGPVLAQYPGDIDPDTGECVELGLRYYFSLEVASQANNNGRNIPVHMNYLAYHPSTPPFTLAKNCVCKVKTYNFEFDFLPQSQDILVETANGSAVPFTGPFPISGGSGAYIRVAEQFLSTSLAIGFSNSVQPQPRLNRAGGFCIVDNISGPRAEDFRTEVYVETGFDEPTATWRDNIFLPYSSLDYLVP